MKYSIVLLLLVLTFFNGQIWCQRNFRQDRQQICYTPDGSYGLCVILPQCPSVINYYGNNQGDPRATQYLFQIQRSCGTRSIGNNPIICCEDAYNNYYNNPIQTPPPNLPTLRTQPTTQSSRTLPPTATQPPTPPPTLPPTTNQPTIDDRASSNCRGPNSRPGNCVDIRNCDELLNLLVENSKISVKNETIANFLRLSNEICRFNGYVTGNSVCCPIKETGLKPRKNDNLSEGRIQINEEDCGISADFKFKRVVGGQDADLAAWPWIALLGYDVLEGSPFKCGGSLITKRHILTAAHCIRSDLRFVRLGEHDLAASTETPTVDINIVKMDRHPKYNSRNGKNDIAILHLKNSVSYTERILPICLPKDPPIRSKSFVGYSPFVAGWGKTQEGGKSSQILQQLQLPILDNKVCRERYAAQRRLVTDDQFDEAVICAGILTGGKDTCQGDSGGPLMYPQREDNIFRFYQIGVVSYGVGCARAEIPGVYSNVPNFIEWIEEKIAA